MKKLTCLFALCLAFAANADTTVEYNVLYAGKKSGAQKTVIGDDGSLRVSYSYRDNGRGPDIEEEISLAADSTFRSYRQRGKTTFGAVLDERFSASRGRASWRTPSEQGKRELDGAAIYLPTYGSPEVSAIIARATQKAPGGRLAALPGGELRSTRLQQARIGPPGQERAVALYAIFGTGLQPDFIWLDAGMRLFASINVGGSQLVVAGFESQAPELERLQKEAESAYLRDIAKKQAQPLASPLLIRNVRVFDTKTTALGEPADVYVQDGRIAAIYPANSQAAAAATVIEGAGRALLPGLFDMHTHEDAWNAILQVAGGVTTSRDMGALANSHLAGLIADIGRGDAIGPHIEPAGYIEGDSPYSSRGDFVVKSVEEAQAAVDWYAQHGYRQIKLYNSIKPEWAAPIAAYAHSRGLRVSGHVPAFSRSERVVRDGYDELQHINQLMLNFVSDPDTDSRTLARFILVGERTRELDLDSRQVRDFIALLAERGTVIDATLATFEAMYTQQQGDMDPTFAVVADHMPFATQRSWRSNPMDVSDGRLEIYRSSWKRMVEFFGRLHAAGVPLVAGTDNIAGFTLHRELELYVEAGMAPGEAIRIATENGARYAGVLGDRGTIERGKRADLILVDGDPTKDISDIRRVSYVLKDGVGYSPADLYGTIGVRRFADPPAISR